MGNQDSATQTNDYKPNPERTVQGVRRFIQVAFAALCIWIGIEFHLFVNFLESGGEGIYPGRPPGVEAFLPISSLMSLYYFILSGEIHPAHPAGFFILLAVLAGSFIVGKSFCSCICPIGLLSEKLGGLGEKVFLRKIAPPRWIDYPLRSLKYLILGFFVYSIFFMMNQASLKAFLDGGYNVASDIKMYYFFAHISRLSLWVIVAILALSIVLRNFWCRYLCPYGALLGILSLVSPSKIVRNNATCIQCRQCAAACPSRIRVDKVDRVYSDECIGCLHCADACPVADTLQMKWRRPLMTIPKKWALAAAAGAFVLITGLGMATGNWRNNVSKEEYLHHHANLHRYDHIRGPKDIDALNRQTADKETSPAD